MSEVTVFVADIFSPLREALGTPFDGILGYSFLREFKLELDYPNQSLRLE